MNQAGRFGKESTARTTNVDHKRLGAYVEELTFKYNTLNVSDGARTVVALQKMDRKCLGLRPLKGKTAARVQH